MALLWQTGFNTHAAKILGLLRLSYDLATDATSNFKLSSPWSPDPDVCPPMPNPKKREASGPRNPENCNVESVEKGRYRGLLISYSLGITSSKQSTTLSVVRSFPIVFRVDALP